MNYATYQTRLKPGIDDELIAYLESARRARRVGQVLRAALQAYMNQGQGQRWVAAPPPAAPLPAAPPMPPPPPLASGDVLSKAKSAFLK